ncbi:hypothetical protein FNV43_RR22568 [Rhamnella rubrinervis]|uniref:Orn/Lys/Arg decarboxylases family 1 pyridoxal-P attachment site domain-containing protein n=1 Tax=Rhamnella rubrinervis TaxID=2594499 RepID=A0A8K0DWF5_9ROSA|nr:hypothetical protein FNV43_RR22568 [Rhamnella rubrinervis]
MYCSVLDAKDKVLEYKMSQQDEEDKHELPPLIIAMKTSAETNPGHSRGRAAPSSLTQLIGVKPFIYDFAALPELDSFFFPKGPILDAQKQAAKVFGSLETWFLIGGTTCGIQAAIMATYSPGDILILRRNSHSSAISALVLAGAAPKYIIVETAIRELEMEGKKPVAVFVTSPTYHGICSNLSEISRLCHSKGNIPLIVDEARGAHLGFYPHLPCSALKQGADLVVQSTHKGLSSLTKSSMLHMSGNIIDREMICRCLQTLPSTSPSCLLLASLVATPSKLSETPKSIFEEAVKLAVEAKDVIKKLPGYEANKMLYRDHDIICELAGSRYVTLVINLGTCREHVERLVSVIKHLVISSQAFVHGGDDDDKAARRVAHGGETITERALDYLLSVRRKGGIISGASDHQFSSVLVCKLQYVWSGASNSYASISHMHTRTD